MSLHNIIDFKRIEDDNKGFSLVEIIIAVAVLAIVFIPVMRSFMQASITNSGAQVIQNATSVAETVMEHVKSTGIEQLKKEAGTDDTMTFTAGTLTLSDGTEVEAPPFNIKYSGISATQGQTYDVNVEIDNTTYSVPKPSSGSSTADTVVSDANIKPLPVLDKEVDASQNAVLSWEINKYDGAALEALLDKNTEDTTAGYSDFTNKSWWAGIQSLHEKGYKELKITINNIGANDIAVKGEVAYIPNDSRLPDYERITYPVYYAEFNKDDMQDIYIFYTLMKNDSEAIKRHEEALGNSAYYMFYLFNENIVIDDSSTGKDFNIYFILQKYTENSTSVNIQAADSKVTVDKDGIKLIINNVNDNSGKLSINNHNLYTNFKYIELEGGTYSWVHGNLYDTETKDKIYNVKVDVVKAGVSSGNPLASITSTMPAGKEAVDKDG